MHSSPKLGSTRNPSLLSGAASPRLVEEGEALLAERVCSASGQIVMNPSESRKFQQERVQFDLQGHL
eukprot:4666656-Amphidinium_carterae.1